MKLVNKTNLQSNQLRHFIREVSRREMVELKRATFTVIYRRISCRGTYIGGYAYYGMPPRVTLKIPKNIPIDKVELAYVIAHELAHSQNLKHNQMRNGRYNRRHKKDWKQYYLWASELPIEREPVKVVIPKNTIVQQKRDKCLKMVDKWESKIKHSQSIYKKWKRKYHYYEHQLEKAAIIPPK